MVRSGRVSYYGTEGNDPMDTGDLVASTRFLCWLRFGDAQAFRHLIIKKTFARPIRLHPLAIDHKLRNRALAGLLDDFFGGPGSSFDVDVVKRKVVTLEKAPGHPAGGTPA